MHVSKKLVVLVLVVGFCLFPTMVAAERPVKQAPDRPTPTGTVPEMIIPQGPHYLTTWEGTTTTKIDLPADFFFTGSDPVDQMVSMEGNPVGPVPGRRDGFKMQFARLTEPGDDIGDRRVPAADAPYDTVMVQRQDVVLSRIGSQARVDLTMEDVRLRSVAPVEVTGTETRYYNVFLEVTAHHQGDGREANTGYMAYTRDGVATGHFTAEVHAFARFIFIPLDGGEPDIYDHDEQLTIGTQEPTPFVIPTLFQGRASTGITPFCCNFCEFCDVELNCGGCHCGG